MWRIAARLGGVALARPCIGSVLASGLAAPALLRASSVSVRSLANLQQRNPTTRSQYDLRLHALGLAAGVDPSTGRVEGLPLLARMARQWLCCPATSAGVERLFSKAGSMHHDLKGAMEDGSLEHSLIANANTE